MDKIEDLWSNQEPTHFPFHILLRELAATKEEVSLYFGGETDQVVGRDSPAFEQIVEFDHKVSIYREVMYTNPVYMGLNERLEQFERVLPPRNFAFEDLLNDLKTEFHPDVKMRLQGLLEDFRNQSYERVLRECGPLEEFLLIKYTNALNRLGITLDASSSDQGQSLGQIRRKLDTEKDIEGLALKKSTRVEQLLLSMFECLHYLRNLGTHVSGVHEDGLPARQVNRRTEMRGCAYARLAVLLALHLAVELQAMEP